MRLYNNIQNTYTGNYYIEVNSPICITVVINDFPKRYPNSINEEIILKNDDISITESVFTEVDDDRLNISHRYVSTNSVKRIAVYNELVMKEESIAERIRVCPDLNQLQIDSTLTLTINRPRLISDMDNINLSEIDDFTLKEINSITE